MKFGVVAEEIIPAARGNAVQDAEAKLRAAADT
jgi:hypothetical protein